MNTLTRLQSWFRSQRNDRWKDGEIDIRSFENPCWFVSINLQHTSVSGMAFTDVVEGAAEVSPWVHCYIEENTWKGAGDDLERVLEVFLSWAETA